MGPPHELVGLQSNVGSWRGLTYSNIFFLSSCFLDTMKWPLENKKTMADRPRRARYLLEWASATLLRCQISGDAWWASSQTEIGRAVCIIQKPMVKFHSIFSAQSFAAVERCAVSLPIRLTNSRWLAERLADENRKYTLSLCVYEAAEWTIELKAKTNDLVLRLATLRSPSTLLTEDCRKNCVM